ncbi:zinc finger protein 501-like isoform X3 [Periplaneta americana]|uniref:zinc finger protein 501-like isoform X3 n=1 Tax=Periplaneta americana TaxID=6978 RepID=UPI0037E89DB3
MVMVTMNVIKNEPDVDPLACGGNSGTDAQERKPSLQEGNLFNPQCAWIKQECMDGSYDFTSEVKREESVTEDKFPVVKNEAENGACELDIFNEDLKLDVTKEEHDVLTESGPLHHNSDLSNEDSSKHSVLTQEESIISQSTSNIVCLDKPASETAFEGQISDRLFTKKEKLKEKYCTKKDDSLMKCKTCGKKFGYARSLKRHLRTHTGEKPYKCKLCNKCFSESGKLKNHLRHHTGEKPFKCNVCSKCFTQSGSLKIHKRQHTGEKPFKCDICGENFPESGRLKRHERQHTGEKPYKCVECGQCFSRSGSLNRHKRHHTGEKPFTCGDCGKRFSKNVSLKKHERQHTA